MSEYFVSIIIPVFNGSAQLQICLSALEKQTYPKEFYEIIVVDNGSQEDIKSVTSMFERVKLVYEPQPGSYLARNTGIAIAAGDIIAFTDSDCIPAPDWIEKGVRSLLSAPNCGLVAGRIELFFQDPEHPTPVELYESIEVNFLQDQNVERDRFGVTANLFTFKDTLKNVGNFDSNLKSGADRQWGRKVFEQGYQQVYAADALVKHPARSSLAQHRRRVSRFVGGRYDLLMSSNPSVIDVVKDWIGSLRPPFRSLFRTWRNPRLKSNIQKLQFTLVMLYTRYIVIAEKLRLYLGGESRRE